MAQSVLKLVVDDKEYEASLKRAKAGMQDLQQSLQAAGKTFDQVDQSVVDYAKAIGNMATVSQTAKGKLNEMTSTFTELSVQYKQLTDEEKNSPFGKALAESLDTLKGRIIDSKRELDDVKSSLSETASEGSKTGGIMEQLKNKFTLNIDALKVFDVALKAGKLALNTFKGAIESTEAGHDALARAIAVTDNVTNQFLRSLATADFSNFLTGMQDIINKTIEAYNAMDEFESYAARFQPWQQAKESEIQAKMMQARAAKAKGENDRAEQLNKEAKDLIDELAKSTQAYGKKQTEGGYATIRSLMGAVDISNEEIAWYADPKNWEEAKQKAQEYADVQAKIDKLADSSITATSYDQRTRTENQKRINDYKAYLQKRQDLRQAYTMMNLRDSGDSEEAQQLRSALSNIYGNTLANSRIESLRARADRIEGVLDKAGLGGKSGGVGGAGTVTPPAVIGSIDEQTKKVQELQKAWRAAADDDSRAKYAQQIQDAQAVLNRMTSTIHVGSVKDLNAQLSELRKKQEEATSTREWESYNERIKQTTRLVKEMKGELGLSSTTLSRIGNVSAATGIGSDWVRNRQKQLQSAKLPVQKLQVNSEQDDGKSFSEVYGQMTSSLSTIASGVEQLGIKIPDSINQVLGAMQGISTILSGIASLVAAIEAISTIDTLIPGFAGGGVAKAAKGLVVPGRHFSGDMMPAMLNSGETVLSSAQTNAVVSQLQHSGLSNLHLSTELSGEAIRIVLNNNNRRRGKGEVVTTKKWG